MGYIKTIVCLANSRKPPSGRCIAGREWTGQMASWVRPVSARPGAEISEEERRFQNGSHPKVLDIVSVPMTKPVPRLHQQENHLIDEGYYWEKKGTVTWAQLNAGVETINGPLWINNHSSSRGLNNRVPQAELSTVKSSLVLIRPEKLVISVFMEASNFGSSRRRVRAKFSLSGFQYEFDVTDPVVEEEYLAGKDGEFKMGDALMCASLGEVFKDGNAYKLAAAIITPKRAGA